MELNRIPERDCLADAAQAAAVYMPNASDWPITGFLACVGRHYEGDLLVVGRAVNTWDGLQFYPDDLRDGKHATAFADQILRTATDGTGDNGPMKWVSDDWGASEGYNTRRSAFWRIAYSTISELSSEKGAGNEWAERLAWSNLYKLAPAEGGNPSERLSMIQFSNCLKLFFLELEMLKPKNVLIMTGLDWAQAFLDTTSQWKRTEGLIEATGVYNCSDDTQCRLVVTPHPQGKAEDELMHEIVSAISS